MASRTRLAAFLYGAAALAYALDRVTKLLAEDRLAGRPPIRLVPGVLQLTFTTNSGGAFGLGRSQPLVFFTATVVVCLIILFASTRLGSTATAVGLGLILGGALGNVTDRILRGPGASGQVIDFIDFRVWPVFNLADSAIVVGAIVVVLAGVWRRDEPRTVGA